MRPESLPPDSEPFGYDDVVPERSSDSKLQVSDVAAPSWRPSAPPLSGLSMPPVTIPGLRPADGLSPLAERGRTRVVMPSVHHTGPHTDVPAAFDTGLTRTQSGLGSFPSAPNQPVAPRAALTTPVLPGAPAPLSTASASNA